MCGILGYFSTPNYKTDIRDKLEQLNHRGPDGTGIFDDSTEYYNLSLGHKRLSIIDLNERSNQPFFSTCRRYAIIFNGEIYNYQELQDKYLPDEKMLTTSDTEVLLMLYMKYKEAMLNMLEGMFALVIYDVEAREIFIARDQLGIKPLYYYKDDQKVIFSSELKAIWAFERVKKEIDWSFLPEFMLNSFLYEPDTGYQRVKKLLPGAYMKISVENGQLNTQTKVYWSIVDKNGHQANSTDSIIEKSIQSHLISDVPVGLFFSGGVDSSIILQNVRPKITPLIVKSDSEATAQSGILDDYTYAKKVATLFETPLVELPLNQYIPSNEAFLESIHQLSMLSEEPLADYTFISSRYISQKSREAGFTVMLSGMGADELFGGYDKFRMVQNHAAFKAISPFVNLFLKNNKKFNKKIQRFNSFFDADDFALKYSSLVGCYSLNDLKKLLPQTTDIQTFTNKINGYLADKQHFSPLKKAMALDLHGFLSHNFLVADKSSMLESIELRVPLATHSIAEHTFGLPDKQLVGLFKTKKILKQYLCQYLPKDIVHRKKTGFNPPLDAAINQLGEAGTLAFLKKNDLYAHLNENEIKQIVAKHFRREENNTFKIYLILYLSAWLANNR